MRLRYSIVSILTLAIAFGSSTLARATTFSYTAPLDGLQEVPPNGTPASGTATLVYDDVANTLTTTVSYSGLLGPRTASHIHTALPGVAGPVTHGLAGGGPTADSFVDVWSGLTAAQVADLNAGKMYVNVHSTVYPGGEIRGQIHPDGVTLANSVSWGRLKTLYR